MASPFYLFRKYQKTFLVIAGVLAMFIFVVADPLMSWLQQSGGGGQRSANTIVASWDGGSLNLQQLESLAQRRYKISQFLQNLIGVAARTIEQEGGTPETPALPNFIDESNDFTSIQLGCVTTRILAEQAKKSGITVSDDFINHYLKEWGLRRMGDAEISKILSRVGLNDQVLFAGLRELLMGNFYINSYSLARLGVTPEERWQDWKRINERISLEAAILPTDKFVAEVPGPSEAQLKEFYELYKNREDGLLEVVMNTRLPSPDPGFREPRRVRIQYLTGNVIEWRDRLLDTVTEAEIADYYERNKRTQFVKTSSSAAVENLFDNERDTLNSDSEEGDSEEGASDEGETTDDAPVQDSETSPAVDESSRVPRSTPFRLAALQTETEAPANEETAEDPESSDDEGALSEESPAATETEVTEDEAPEAYEPLDNVRDEIRRSLANDKAVVELQKVVDQTMASLQTAYNPYGFKVVTAQTEETEIPDPPAQLSDYKAIAAATGLTSEETVLLSQQELYETNVGKAFDAQSGTEFVVQGMFGVRELYEPYRARDIDGNSYIVCKLEDVPSRVPEFEEVRDAVLAAWKKREAAKLALAKAEELAKLATESGDTVAVVARGAGFETKTTDMFSWLSFGLTAQEMQRGPRLGDAPPLEAVNNEFMTKAFELQPAQKIALLNHDQTNAYVVQLDHREQTEAEMRQLFLQEANTWFGVRVMNSARWGAAQRTLLGQLSQDLGLNLDKLEEILTRDSQ